MAMSLAQKAEWKKVETEAENYVKSLKDNYGVAPELVVNKESFDGKEMSYVTTFIWAITEGLSNVCSKGADEKGAVADGIRKIDISFGQPSFKKDGVTLAVVTDLGATDNAATVRDKLTTWLMNNL